MEDIPAGEDHCTAVEEAGHSLLGEVGFHNCSEDIQRIAVLGEVQTVEGRSHRIVEAASHSSEAEVARSGAAALGQDSRTC